ncbi:nucleoside-diphosphate-sugar epimerase [Longilinea arvoryzae]|uniref:Nucleoside-diphosphate-sugar epimerase n=1 Tax=Longilinea arvoryzae TaxID=360412 RepID=A0A0S7BD83_9CHLR|nr:NAD-dependent epimerase/dehydratase family protein [Longilinea arvoryzae]GAP15767.1 nucleoside-diphosphate-sugar epimerase [Longilinea arvoryzae]
MSDIVLVTGASGLVGANLTRALLKQGRDVRALVHEDRRALEGLEVEAVQADIRDLEALERALAGVDVVYHLAGSISLEMDSGPEMEAVNAMGTRNVVSACLRCGVRRLVHFSSIDALSPQPYDVRVDETRPLIDEDRSAAEFERISPYQRSKAQSEREVHAGIDRGLDAVILRPTAIFGPNDFKPSFIGQALIQLARGRIPALVRGGFDWVDVRDVVMGALRAEQIAPTGAHYLLGGHWQSIREVAERVAAVTGQPAPRFNVPIELADAFAPVMLKMAHFNGTHPIYTKVTLDALRGNRQVNCARATRDLGYTARPLDETVRDTLNWFHEHGYLAARHP